MDTALKFAKLATFRIKQSGNTNAHEAIMSTARNNQLF